MGGSKPFGPGEDFPPRSSIAGKPILVFDPETPIRFIDLIDTIANYTGSAGKFIVVNPTETGLAISLGDSIKDKNYIHTQDIASDEWIVEHYLGKYPSVRLQDVTGHSMVGDIVDVDLNSLTITFSSPQTGKAIIN
jgi:hypothetical protein